MATDLTTPHTFLDSTTGTNAFELYSRAFLASYTSPNTRRGYRHDLATFAAWCAGSDVNPLTCRRAHVDTYMHYLETLGLAPATRARRLTTLRAFYRYLLEDELVDRNPADAVRAPKVSHEDQPYLNRVQITLLLETAELAHGYRWPLVSLLFVSGLRISEVTGANVGDLGSERHHRTLRILGKGDKPANPPLPPQVYAAIDRHLKERGTPGPGEPLLVSDRGNRLHRNTACHQLKRLCKAAGVPEVSPHALRHSVITLLLLDGVPLRDVQLFARHADPSTTSRYDAAARSLDAHASYSVARALA